VRALAAVAVALCVVACATTQGNFRPLGKTYPPKPATFEVQVFQSTAPTQPFERIARVDAHFEKTHFVSTSLDAAIEELKKQARAAGADAIIEIDERRSRLNETMILHVSATAIHFTEPLK
jgi:hypothetical protein